MAESVTIRLVGEDAGAKALIAQVRAEVDKLGKSGNESGKALTSAFAGFDFLKGALGVVAKLAGAAGIAELVHEAIGAAAELHKMSQQTGVSAETLSVLKLAAEEAGTDVDSLARGLKFLSVSIADVQRGSPEAIAAFRAIGIESRDIKGLALDQVFKLVADRLDKFADGAGKVAIAQKLLGKNGIELLPVLKNLANEGFAEVTKKAQEMGVIISTEAAAAAEKFTNDVGDLKREVFGLSQQFLGGILPALTEFVKILRGEGEPTKTLTSGLNDLNAALNSLAPSAAEAQRALDDFEKRGKKAGEVGAFITEAILKARLKLAQSREFTDVTGGASTAGKPELPVVDEAAARARIARSVALLQQEAALIAAKNKIVEQDNKAAFEKGLTALDDYYENRRTILNRETNAEVEILKRQRAVVQSIKPATPADQIAQAQAADAINAQIALKQQARGLENAQLDLEQFQAKKKLSEDIIGFEATILAARGQTVEATKLQIDEEIRKDRELLLQRRALTAEDERQLETKRALLTQRAQFDNLSAQSDRVFADVANQRAAIELQASQGLISQREAEHQIALLEQSRIPVLKQLAADMLAFAESTKDPALIAAAQNLAAQIGGLGIERSLNQARVAMANFKDDAIDALGSSLANFLGSGINQVHSLGDAFRSLALSAVESLQRIIGQILALQAVEAIRRALGRGEEAVGAAASATAISSAGAAAGTAIATGSAAAATTLTTAGTAAGAAIGIGAGRAATALGFSAGALSTSGAVLSAAAKELLAAATALAAAGTGGGGSNLLTGLLGLAGGGAPGGGPSISFASPGVPSLGPMPLVGSLSLSDLSVSPLSLRDFSSLQAPTFTAADREIGAGPGGFGGEVSVTIGLEEGLVAREMKKPAGVKATVHNIGNNPKAINSVLGRR